MYAYFCNDIMRVCRIVQAHKGVFCVDLEVPGSVYVPGVCGSISSSPNKHVCEYSNNEVTPKNFDAILVNKFNLNIVGGVLAACGQKPEDGDFWRAAARYTPSHFENFNEYPEGISRLNVDRIRAIDLDLNTFSVSFTPQNAADVMPVFYATQEKLRYILASSEGLVHELAGERIQQMGREIRGLSSISVKDFTKKSLFQGADFRSENRG